MLKGSVRMGWVMGIVVLAIATAACSDGGATPSRQEAAGPLLADTTLRRMLAEIQPEVERSSGLVATSPLNVAATNEARLREYLEAQLGTQLTEERAAAITAVYARMGLVPEDLDLRALLAELLEEQVVGYYDPVSDTLFVHERVPADELAPVLAHELVHALQDQYVPLDSIGDSFGDRSDAAAAYQAAVEGHATFAMMEWQFASMTGQPADLTALPDLGPMLESIDLTALGEFGSADVLAAAPAVIREGLIFPYISGLLFVQRAWTTDPGRPLPFREGLPGSTEQILHVDRWLDLDPPTVVTFEEAIPETWDEVYASDFGEFEIRLWLEELLEDPVLAERASAGWDGDAYRLLRKGHDEALVWVSVWDSPGEAEEFAAAARRALEVRYPSGERVTQVSLATSGRPTVTIVDRSPELDVPTGVGRAALSGN